MYPQKYYVNDTLFVYEDADDHIILRGCNHDNINSVVIPDQINRKPVTIIAEPCFSFDFALEYIHFPNSLLEIESGSFAMCQGLQELILPDSVIKIGSHAFRDCRALKKIILPSNLERLEHGLFSFCKLKGCSITLPANLRIIESNVFFEGIWDDVMIIDIPRSVERIDRGAFFTLIDSQINTTRPHDRAWFNDWPYGEQVCSCGHNGFVSDYQGGQCGLIVEVDFGERKHEFHYPVDFMGKTIFVDEKQQRRAEAELSSNPTKYYKGYELWQKGFGI